MAVAGNTMQSRETASGRRMKVGANVALSIALLLGVVGFLQFFGFKFSTRWSMSSSGVTSLTEPTEKLIEGLDKPVRLTSLYFETDREEEDQQRYRRAAWDLLGLYQATNRSKVSIEWVNPLKDLEKYKAIFNRLADKGKSKVEVEKYKAEVDRFRSDLAPQISALLQADQTTISGLTGGFGGGPERSPLAEIEAFLAQHSDMLSTLRKQVEENEKAPVPEYGNAMRNVKTAYRTYVEMLEKVGAFASGQLAGNPALPESQAEFLRGAKARYEPLVTKLKDAQKAADELKPLELDNLQRELDETSNAILVETDDDARAVDFNDVWPVVRPEVPSQQIKFKDRAFKGEEALTSAILRVTHKEQTAVVFVRFGGAPLFFGGFMPNQPRAPMSGIKERLEDANFAVSEWDVKADKVPPAIEPAPTRTIHVMLRPMPPQPGPMGQPPQEPGFGEADRKAVLDAVGKGGRMMFIAGWAPGQAMAGMMLPGSYDYNDYLEKTWGVKVDPGTLLLHAMNIAPGKYVFSRGAESMDEGTGLQVANHLITSNPKARQLYLPMCAPLIIAEKAPEGVSVNPLITQPRLDGVWGVKDVTKYQSQLNNEYVTKVEGDAEGPFVLAAAAEKGDGKCVVVGSDSFAFDQVALAMGATMEAQGFVVRSRNPGNVLLLLNSLHWLADSTESMNIGQPIDSAVLEIPKESSVTMVKALTIVVWPALALCCGGIAWWVRRK